MIVPISIANTPRFAKLRNLFNEGMNLFANFSGDTNPGVLFTGVKQNLTIFTHRNQEANTTSTTYSTDFIRFYNDYRTALFSTINYHTGYECEYGYYKIGKSIEQSVFNKATLKGKIGALLDNKSNWYIFMKTTSGSHYKLFFKEAPFFSINDEIQIASSFKPLYFQSNLDAYTVLAALNSNLFNIWWCSLSDGRNVTSKEVASFPITVLDSTIKTSLKELGVKLMNDLNEKSNIVTYRKKAGVTKYAQFSPRASKTIIDEIDKVLAKHYGFTEEELDFIINYDIKYRMGDELNGEE